MKKAAFLILLCALVTVMGTAWASTVDMVVPVYDQREDGSVFLCTAVSAGEGNYVSGGVGKMELVQPYVLTKDGLYYVSHLQQFTNGMTLFTTKSTQEPASISPQEPGGTILLASYDAHGLQMLTGRVVYHLTWRGAPCYLVEGSSEVSMGTAVFDGTQSLLGVVVAAWGEGVHRYVMLPVSSFTIEEGKANEKPATTAEPAAFHQWVENCTVTLEGILMKVTWEQSALENAREDSHVSVFLADERNTYYSWVHDDASQGVINVPVVPGRTYYYAVQHSYGDTVKNVNWTEKATKITVPAAEPFALYDYQDVSIYLGTLPATEEGYAAAEAQPVEKITRELLADESLSLFLQVTSRYTVDKEEGCDMILTLSTPDGNVFSEPASYSFLPEIMEKDVWNANLDSLLDNYYSLKQRFEPGEYVIQYYFDGALVNTVRFTLE